MHIIKNQAIFSGGSLDTGGNVLCLDTWQNGEAGPWMHSIHFSFAIGAFLAPVISVPFLGKTLENEQFNSTLNIFKNATERYFEYLHAYLLHIAFVKFVK